MDSGISAAARALSLQARLLCGAARLLRHLVQHHVEGRGQRRRGIDVVDGIDAERAQDGERGQLRG